MKHLILDIEHQSWDALQAIGKPGSKIKREVRIEAINYGTVSRNKITKAMKVDRYTVGN